MGISVISVCAILAIIPLYWLPVLPGIHSVWVLIAAGVALGVQKKNALKLTGAGLLFFCWGILAAQESVWPMAHLTAGPQRAEVMITATDASGKDRYPERKTLVGLNGHHALWKLSAAARVRWTALGHDASPAGGAW